MKKLLILALATISMTAQAAPWDLNGQQYDQFGTSIINRLMPLPAGPVNAIYYYDAGANLPKLATYDSSLLITSSILQVNPSLLAGKFDTPTGNSGQYITGAGALAAFPTAVSFFSNDSAYVNQAGARSAVSLTTTGSSGAATYNSSTGVLNIPNYATGAGTVTSVTAGSGLSGGTFTTSGTISMPATGTAGTYSSVTTDAQGRVTAGTNSSQSAQTRSLNSAFQVSATRPSLVVYSVQITVTASIAGGQNGDVILEIASDSGFTTNVQTLSITGSGQTYTLAVALQGVQPTTNIVSGFVPAGYYARLRTVNNTGTPTFAYRAGQEVIM